MDEVIDGVERIVATVESELEQRLAAAEARIAELMAAAAVAGSGRKTLAVGDAAGAMVSKGGVAVEASAVDAALVSLSIEQRIAVKAELMRAGVL